MSTSAVVVVIFLYGLSRCFSLIRCNRNPLNNKDDRKQEQTSSDREYRRFESAIIYILAINLLQCAICSFISFYFLLTF